MTHGARRGSGRWRAAAGLAVAALTLLGCTDADDDGDAASTLLSASPDGASAVDPTSRPRATSTTAGPSTTETTLPPPEGLERLAPGLLSAAQVGVPDTWAPLDFDPAVVDDPELVGDVDPFRGLVQCPPVVRDAESPWIARKFSAVDAPMDNGLLTVEVILELETAADHAADVDELATCEPVPQSSLTPTTPTVELIGVRPRLVPATGFQVVAEPTDDVPFPYVIEVLWVHDQDVTVGVVLGGQPADPARPSVPADWTEAAQRIAAQALGSLVDV